MKRARNSQPNPLCKFAVLESKVLTRQLLILTWRKYKIAFENLFVFLFDQQLLLFILFHRHGKLPTTLPGSKSASASSLFFGIQIFRYSWYFITQKLTWYSFSRVIGIGSSILSSRFFATLLLFAVHKNKITHSFYEKFMKNLWKSLCNAKH